MKSFWLARRSDGHRYDGSRISADNIKHAETIYRRLNYELSASLMIVGARREA